MLKGCCKMKDGMAAMIIGWGVYFLLALGCQCLFDTFPVACFAFPVNVLLWLLCAAGLWMAFKRKPDSVFVRTLASTKSTLLLLLLFFITCLVYGLTGRTVTATWWLVALLWALTSHLLMVLYNGTSRHRRHKPRFILIHAGLLSALLGGFLGVPDRAEWRMVIDREHPVLGAIDQWGNTIKLKRSVVLTALHGDALTSNAVPDKADGLNANVYAAELLIDGREHVMLRVNHPYRLSWSDDLYLVELIPAGLNNGLAGCVVQGVRQPWKYVEWAGIWLLIAGCVLLFVQGAARRKRKGEDA